MDENPSSGKSQLYLGDNSGYDRHSTLSATDVRRSDQYGIKIIKNNYHVKIPYFRTNNSRV